MFASTRFKSAPHYGVATIIVTAVVSVAACSGDREPTAPRARESAIVTTQAQAAQGGGGGTRTYGIRAHGRVRMETAPVCPPGACPLVPVIVSGSKNLVEVTQPSVGTFCIRLPDDVVLSVNDTPGMLSISGPGYGTLAYAGVGCPWIGLRVSIFNIATFAPINLQFDILLP